MASIRLYHFPPSAPCRFALMTARTLGLNVDIKLVNLLKKEQFAEDFLKINPQHSVPTIDDSGFYLWDSHAISTYLVGKYGPKSGLYPADLKVRAAVDQNLYFDAVVLFQRIRAVCVPFIYGTASSVPNDLKQGVVDALDILDKSLLNKTWLVDEKMTVADIANAATVSNAVVVGYDLSKHPNVAAWFNCCKNTIKGFDENLKGADEFRALVQANHPAPLFP
ncbi:Glutathione S-transferase 1, isoform D [Frankliniella fusca]|uniref:Glutathione S-transferase 1, isoform D n=1 Tax=Frankliniella fusca TaxID=407009 RepID=A0AAE1L7K9_9NEOP|nr:Glutathione S-transferase 1, isoform D [Frankliniella fusca]